MEVFETIIHNCLTKIKFKESITSLKLIKKKKIKLAYNTLILTHKKVVCDLT